MPDYRLSLDFTAADDTQAARLALAWADTCSAEYGTRMAGFERIDPEPQRMCSSIDHEQVAATWVGTYDDGDHVQPDVAYCDDCARLVQHHGWYASASQLPANSCYQAQEVFDKRTRHC